MTWRVEPRIQKAELKAMKNHSQALSPKQETANLCISSYVFKWRTELGLLYLKPLFTTLHALHKKTPMM